MSLNWLIGLLLSVYFIVHLTKFILICKFFERQKTVTQLSAYPKLSLIQPVTRSPNDLATVLASRAVLTYPSDIEQIIVVDRDDQSTRQIVDQVLLINPDWKPMVIAARSATDSDFASKIEKMNAGLAAAGGDILCFVDDDILLPENGLVIMADNLARSGNGAVFGLACYNNYKNFWSGLMSAFVNNNALYTYIPAVYFIDPYTVTGHCYAITRSAFNEINQLDQMLDRQDDDHEIARRLRHHGYRLCQTNLIYQVDNNLPNRKSYLAQFKRWFVFPRQTMLPYLSVKEKLVTGFTSISTFIPGFLLVFALIQIPQYFFAGFLPFLVAVAIFFCFHFPLEKIFLKPKSPGWIRWPLSVISLIEAPLEILLGLFSDNTIEWRGQRMELHKNGKFTRR